MRGSRRDLTLAVLLAIVFLAFHLPYLPASLEDLDSINFALGIRQFNVAEHQPHPPGYPLFIALAKAAHLFVRREEHALALISIVAGALGALAVWAFFRALGAVREGAVRADDDAGDPATQSHQAGAAATSTRAGRRRARAAAEQAVRANDARADETRKTARALPLCATLLAVASPLYWFTAARPLSDAAGLAAAVAVQAMILSAATSRALVVASLCAALAAGVRSQVVWLTVPLLVVQLARMAAAVREAQGDDAKDRGAKDAAASGDSNADMLSFFASIGLAYAVGILVWLVPLVALTGGPRAYWSALSFQGTADLTDIQMLWTTPTPRAFVSALYYAFVAPWAVWPLAAAVLVLAAAGAAVRLFRRSDRTAAVVLVAAFGPYFFFDLVFQETFTTRYALPLVLPIAYLAARGAWLLTRPVAIAIVVVVAAACAHVGGTSVAAFAREKAPAFRLLDDMRSAAQSEKSRPALAMDRREAFDLRRPIRWVGSDMAPVEQTLQSPPQHEWLELVKYWNGGGGRTTAWFLADPLRTDIDLVAHDEPTRYRWPVPYPVLLGGVRPNEIDFYRLPRPEWYLGHGWSLTPEAAGVAHADNIDPSRAPIEAWVSQFAFAHGVMVLGGRNLGAAAATVTLTRDDRPDPLFEIAVEPGPFLRMLPLAVEQLAPSASDVLRYINLHVRTSAGSTVAFEQFDASAARPLTGFGPGWHEPEYNPRLGLSWRWLSDRGELSYHVPAGGTPIASPADARPLTTGQLPPRNVVLHLEGESPLTYFSRPSVITLRVGDRPIRQMTLVSDFNLNLLISRDELPDADGTITLETDQTYVPAERSRRIADRRRLGLRIYKCELRIQR